MILERGQHTVNTVKILVALTGKRYHNLYMAQWGT
jgi:hypothetical protein